MIKPPPTWDPVWMRLWRHIRGPLRCWVKGHRWFTDREGGWHGNHRKVEVTLCLGCTTIKDDKRYLAYNVLRAKRDGERIPDPEWERVPDYAIPKDEKPWDWVRAGEDPNA